MNEALMADHTVKHYVCARCWGHLVKYFRDGEIIIECPNDECNGQGYVTKYYAEKRKLESSNEKLEIKQAFWDLGIVEDPNAGKTADELLNELGF